MRTAIEILNERCGQHDVMLRHVLVYHSSDLLEQEVLFAEAIADIERRPKCCTCTRGILSSHRQRGSQAQNLERTDAHRSFHAVVVLQPTKKVEEVVPHGWVGAQEHVKLVQEQHQA